MKNANVMFSGRTAVAGSAEEMVLEVVKSMGGTVVKDLSDEPNYILTAKVTKKLEKEMSKMQNGQPTRDPYLTVIFCGGLGASSTQQESSSSFFV